MALNLFTKSFQAYQSQGSGSSDQPTFLICEQDDTRANAFIEEAKQKGGAELSSRIERVGSGNE